MFDHSGKSFISQLLYLINEFHLLLNGDTSKDNKIKINTYSSSASSSLSDFSSKAAGFFFESEGPLAGGARSN